MDIYSVEHQRLCSSAHQLPESKRAKPPWCPCSPPALLINGLLAIGGTECWAWWAFGRTNRGYPYGKPLPPPPTVVWQEKVCLSNLKGLHFEWNKHTWEPDAWLLLQPTFVQGAQATVVDVHFCSQLWIGSAASGRHYGRTTLISIPSSQPLVPAQHLSLPNWTEKMLFNVS